VVKCPNTHNLFTYLEYTEINQSKHRYINEELKVLGRGLFVMGGNPLYYTTKGTPTSIADEVHAIIRQNKEDLGGHHIVFKTATDGVTGDEYMYIDKAPLTAATIYPKGSTPSPAWSVYQHSLLSSSTHGSYGWLSNLAAIMAYEDNDRLKTLYPTAHTQTNSKWSCPMRRMAFWTKLVSDFNPLVPSPVRSERLFGNAGVNMVHGTRSHPTQLFRNLTRVATILTSNGFCFCANAADCQLSVDADDVCSLSQIIKSLHDKSYRPAKILETGDEICTDQLDWPFEGGEMRDGTYSASVNNQNTECNVIDRLPPFQYKYVATGTIYKPSTQRTTIDEGGSCHMGPAAAIPTNMNTLIDTRECRTIYKNHSHVVARCALSLGQTEDIEMERERSKAPTWMTDHLKEVRQKCDTCSGTPVWKTEKSDEELPSGPEVSYGIPFRWSAARLLAADIQKVLCGTIASAGAACTELLNIDAWDLDNFIGNFMGTSSNLFKGNTTFETNILDHTRFTDGRPDESLLWNGEHAGWVACNQVNYPTL
jgi:hypothetical protein